MSVDDMTLGELSRRLDAMERRLEAEFSKIGRSIESLNFVHIEQYRAERDALRSDVADIRDNLKWIVRSVVAALLFPLLVTIGVAIVVGK